MCESVARCPRGTQGFSDLELGDATLIILRDRTLQCGRLP